MKPFLRLTGKRGSCGPIYGDTHIFDYPLRLRYLDQVHDGRTYWWEVVENGTRTWWNVQVVFWDSRSIADFQLTTIGYNSRYSLRPR